MINIGVIKEYKIPNDYRVPFTPNQAKEIKELDGFNVVCQKSEIRCYKEEEYKEQGISIVNQLDESDVIFGIKEVPVNKLIENKTYFMFSHTIKKQPYNRDLLKTIIKKKIRLIDYECLTEGNKRIVAFGKYAGIAGTYNTLIAYGIKYKKYDFQRLSKFKNTKDLYKFSSKNPLSDPIKILIIGNAPIKKKNMGKIIDNFDYVVSFNNYKLEKRINKLEGDMYLTNIYLNNTSMKLEMFLDMIEDEMHSSIRRISRPIAREEVIKGFQEFAENFRNAGVQKGSSNEIPNEKSDGDK